ncbi:hypothetical protein B0H67DRAFT_582145 [Lasiosphaeris hirsuta]|uniref:Secreted protein n=1 Tax=Lasiosphaeris hirsuta TaxID=260670 RepID=A0AA40AHL3_9PEZI|nr:hypothetical protein B0H67DRAFT_582145 [Lasiosphaeris hirsuta]
MRGERDWKGFAGSILLFSLSWLCCCTVMPITSPREAQYRKHKNRQQCPHPVALGALHRERTRKKSQPFAPSPPKEKKKKEKRLRGLGHADRCWSCAPR